MKNSDEERRRDFNWRRAEKLIKEANLEEMSRRRNLATKEAAAKSAPTEAPLKHCFMTDAMVLRRDASPVLAHDLVLGDVLQALVVQQGKFVQAECSRVRVQGASPGCFRVAAISELFH